MAGDAPRKGLDVASRSASVRVLKADLFGRIERDVPVVRRDTRPAAWWLQWMARTLAAREARALDRLRGVPQVPQLQAWDGKVLVRSWIAGQPMHDARPVDPDYWLAALRLLRSLHRRGIAHNDLAKEPNWLVTEQGLPAIVDFQLATLHPRRSALFRLLAREDLRHLLKHKRTYCPQLLTHRQRAILATPSLPARLMRRLFKPVYNLVTRRLLGWRDREGKGMPVG